MRLFLGLLAGVLMWGLTTFPSLGNEPFVIGEKRNMKSEILHEKRTYYVSLPASYNNKKLMKKSYPVLYILDGARSFHFSSGIVHYMGISYQIPEMIVVAISNSRHRMRDLTPTYSAYSPKGVIDEKSIRFLSTSGGGDDFLRFVKDELIPKIDSKYRTIAHRTFVGHSLGGLTVMHSFFTQKNLFQNYIGIDSSFWWDRSMMISKMKNYKPKNTSRISRIFLSLANHDPKGYSAAMSTSNLEFNSWLQKRKTPKMKVKFQQFPNEDHGSVPLGSLYAGLLHVFEGYKPDDMTITDVTKLSKHFSEFSKDRGINFLPSERLVDYYARRMLGERARGFLALNLKNYPTSQNAIRKMEKFKTRTQMAK